MSGWVLLPACAGACVLVLVLAIENAMSEEYKSAWGVVHQTVGTEQNQIRVPRGLSITPPARDLFPKLIPKHRNLLPNTEMVPPIVSVSR
jgi:hypothetical protein